MHLRKILMLAAIAAAACNAKKTGTVTVSAGAATAASTTASTGGTPLPDGVTLTSLDVGVQKLELDGGECAAAKAEGGSSSGSSGSGDDCEAEIGPFIAHLDATALGDLAAGKVPKVWTATLPAGTYSELEAEICAVDPSTLKDEAQAALAAAMKGASVVLQGTYLAPGSESAVSFTVSVSACAEIERHVNVTVDDKGAISNLTIQVSFGQWFYDAQGKLIPPDTAQGIAAIAANIAATLDVYGDDDRDGKSDG